MPSPSLRSSASSLHSSPSSFLTPSSSAVQVGETSLSPGDALVECLLPRVAPSSWSRKSSVGSSSPYSSKSSTKLNSPAGGASGIDVLPLDAHPAVLQAQGECRSLLSGNDVRVLEDPDVREPVVQVLGRDAELVLPTRNAMRYLVLFVKNLARFFSLHVEVLDDKRKYRELCATNARSLARVDLQAGHGGTCQLPLLFGGDQEGWRYLCMDLQELTREAFGTTHVATTLVRIGGDCCVLRAFFQDERYADAELPPHLTFLG